MRFTPEERLKDMDAQGVDVQVLSIHTPFFGYHLDAAQGRRSRARSTTRSRPCRASGPSASRASPRCPVQDVKAAIDELERAVTVLGLKGAELDTQVNGEQWDEPKFLPFFKAAEAMGAVLFFHPQPQHNFLMQRTPRDGLFNSLGVILDDAIVVAILIAGGVLEACPEAPGVHRPRRRPRLLRDGPARPRLAGPSRGAPHPRSRRAPTSAASTTTRVAGSEEALRFLLDQVGADRVVLGSDWPFVPWHPSPVAWVQGLASLTQEEKERVLWRNLEQLLGL